MKKIYQIGLDARPLSTGITGVGRMIAELLRNFPQANKYQFHLFSHKEIHPQHESLLEHRNIHWHSGQGMLAKKGALYFNLYLPLHIRQYQLDLFWGSQQVIPPFLPPTLPVVLTYYDFVLYLFPSTMRKIAALQQKMFQSLSIKNAVHISCISSQTRDDLVKLFHYPLEHTSVIYPGIQPKSIVELLRKNPGEKIKNLPAKYFLSVSTMEPRKNYPFLLQAYAAYRKIAGKNKIPWIIAGKKGWETEAFYKQLDLEMQHQDIILVESPSDSDLHHLYKNATVFLFASVYEGFGIPLLEALYHHRKSIVSDIPTFREIGEDQILYLPVSDAQHWAEAMLAEQKSRKRPVISLDKFLWDYSSQLLEKIFSSILAKNP